MGCVLERVFGCGVVFDVRVECTWCGCGSIFCVVSVSCVWFFHLCARLVLGPFVLVLSLCVSFVCGRCVCGLCVCVWPVCVVCVCGLCVCRVCVCCVWVGGLRLGFVWGLAVSCSCLSDIYMFSSSVAAHGRSRCGIRSRRFLCLMSEPTIPVSIS